MYNIISNIQYIIYNPTHYTINYKLSRRPLPFCVLIIILHNPLPHLGSCCFIGASSPCHFLGVTRVS